MQGRDRRRVGELPEDHLLGFGHLLIKGTRF